MTKVGKSINVRHQLCLAHVIQLTVIKVIYNNKKNPKEILKETISEDSDYDEDDTSNVLDLMTEITTDYSNVVINIKLYPLISQIRKVVRIFRHSPTKIDNLQKHVVKDFGKELTVPC